MATFLSQVEAITASVLEQLRQDHFAGKHPFDGLNSKLFEWMPGLKSGIFGLAGIQFFNLNSAVEREQTAPEYAPVVRVADKHDDRRNNWIKELDQRRGKNISAVAVANNNARIA